jgi:WD40 repeat protein
VKINANCAHVATCATDGYIRVWSLEKSTLGEPVATLQCGENSAVFLHWHPKLPNVLAYASGSGGACCIWDAAPGGGELALRPGHAFAPLSTGLSRRALEAAAAGKPSESNCAHLRFLCLLPMWYLIALRNAAKQSLPEAWKVPQPSQMLSCR